MVSENMFQSNIFVIRNYSFLFEIFSGFGSPGISDCHGTVVFVGSSYLILHGTFRDLFVLP